MVTKFANRLARNNKGQGLVEYGILVAGVALIALVTTSVLGHKTSSMIGTLAAILPGTEVADSGAITSGSLIETTGGGTQITLDPTEATDPTATDRLDTNTGITSTNPGTSVLVVDPG
jgi:pilus assembly protein Flp/PilA